MKTQQVQIKILTVSTFFTGIILTQSLSGGALPNRSASDFTPIKRLVYSKQFLGPDYPEQLNLMKFDSMKLFSFIQKVTEKRLPASYKAQSQKIAGVIMEEATRYEIDPLFILAQIDSESRFRPMTIGQHGEIGLLQVKPSTARIISEKMGISFVENESLFDPVQNIKIGLAYLMQLRQQYKAQYSTAFVDAYNMGPARLSKRIVAGKIGACSYTHRIRSKMVGYYSKLETFQMDWNFQQQAKVSLETIDTTASLN